MMVLGFVLFMAILGTFFSKYYQRKPYDLFGLFATTEKTK